jgi:hypothetical protein
MSIQVYPTPVTSSGGSATAQSVAVAVAGTLYRVNNINLAPGLYNITANTIGTLTMTFYNSADSSITSITTSGTSAVNLTETVSYIILHGTSAPGTAVITLVASQLSPIAGTVAQLTSSGTWNAAAGTGYMLIVGGGGGGGRPATNANQQQNASGGGSGGVYEVGPVTVNTGTTYNIGAQGNAGNLGNAGNSGGATTFGNYTANGGAGGGIQTTGAAGGTPGGAKANDGPGTTPPPVSTAGTLNYVKTGTTGPGGRGWNDSNQTQAGSGSGIGTGGRGASVTTGGSINTGESATGYGAGGGGGAQYTNHNGAGGNGSQGTIYIQVVPNA